MARLAVPAFVMLASLALPVVASAQATEPSAREKAVAIARANPVQGAAAIELFVGGQRHPWCIAFTPDGDILVTEKHHGLRVVRIRLWEQNCKLVPSEPRHHIRVAQSLPQEPRHSLEHIVASFVAEGVVDILEVVEIDDQYRSRSPVAGRSLGLLRELLFEVPPVV